MGTRRAAGVAHDGGKVREECLEAVDGCAILVVPPCDLGFRCGRAFGRRHRVTGGLGRLILIGEEQFPPGLAHMPLNVVGEHAEEDVGPHSVTQTMVDGTDLEVDGLQGTKRAFDL